MTENEAGTGASAATGDVGASAEGRPDDATLEALPAKLRVHALAKLVGSSSREVLAVLARLDVAARSAQSSVDRSTALRVVDQVFPTGEPEAPEALVIPVTDDGSDDAVVGTAAGDAEAAEPVTGAINAPAVAAAAAPAALFLAPESTGGGTGSGAGAPASDDDTEGGGGGRRRRRGSRSSGVVTPAKEAAGSAGPATEAPDAAEGDTGGSDDDEDTDDSGPDDGDGTDDSGRRRRRRGRRGRGRGRGGDDGDSADDTADGADTDESEDSDDAEDSGSADADSDDEGADGSSSGSSRRRRRRRRRGGDDSGGSAGSGDGGGDDPPNTVTHVREKSEKADKGDRRSSDDEVKGVKGSTRLEAKRQRRRDGRDAGRRRPSILSESEFLARREAVERTMVVRQQADRSQIGVLEDGVLVEHFVAGVGQNSMVGNVYLGRVQNVLPSMEAAFVDIGRGRNAVLYAGEVNWDASGLEGKQRKIEQALSSGDAVLVQVTKDPVGHKGARLTTQISLPGRFLVYVPGGGATGISRKLPEPERKRLKEILKRIVPDEAGVIIRTAAEGVESSELEADVRRLAAQWEVIAETGEQAAGSGKGKGKPKAPSLVHEEPDLLIRVVRDMFNEDFSSLVISGEQAWETLEGYIAHVAPELSPRLSRHVGPEDVFSAYRIDEQLVKALDRKVWLPSGGTLVIDRTEAMTVVDVNTGKFTGSGGNLEETVTRNNLEAAEEVVRQLRLRDIGGMIVVDFIDMVLESNRDLVLRRLTECLGRDRTRHQVAEVTSLGLVQMTRKRVGQGLLDEFSTPCEHCKGRGVIVSSEPVVESAGGHGHGSGSNGSGSGSGSNGSPGADSGTNGSNGSSSGRRRGRGRRGASSDGGSPTTTVETTTAGNGLGGHVPSPADVAGARRGAPAAEDGGEPEAAEPEVALEAALADESPGAPADASGAPATAPGPEGAPAGPVSEEPDQPEAAPTEATPTEATPTEAAPTEANAPVADEATDDVVTAADEPEVALEAEQAQESGGAPAAPDPAGPVSEEPDQPEQPEASSGSGRRRRRGASRPAGPPVAVGGT